MLAFQKYDVVNARYVFAGFDNFNNIIINIVNTGMLLSSLKNSLLYYVIHTAVGTTACLLFSYYIFKKRFASKVFKTMLFLPSIISSIALSLMFKYFINNGISVALLAVNNPIAVIFSGVFMAMLDIVGQNLTGFTAYNEYITDVIIAVIVYLSAFSLVIRTWFAGKKKKEKAPEVKKTEKGGEQA